MGSHLPIKVHLIFVFASTSIGAIRHLCLHWTCFLNQSSGCRSGRSELTLMSAARNTSGRSPNSYFLCKYTFCCTRIVSHQLTHPATVVILTRQCRPGFPPCEETSHGSRLARCVPEKDSTSFGWSKKSCLICAMRHSETFRRTSQTKPTMRESL